ncbi:MAG: glycoside hydrolase family 3 protein [Spirochaetales bacterium]|nr:glycoside hydrolase family 3 protein [Spirochaetales bacterium]
MGRTTLASFLTILFFTLSVFQSPALDFWDDLPEEELATALIEEMTDQELLGQVLILGYYGGEPSPEIEHSISFRKLGGVKVFGWNVTDLPTLAQSVLDMQELSQETRFRIPLLMVTDQEGGWVRHIRKGTSSTTGNLGLGATNIPRDSYLTGYYIGLEMKSLGINMNFAPTVDIYNNPEAHVIGPRAFSDDPVQTAILATAFFKGMDATGVISTAKHFPGHGNADTDSHSGLPIIRSTLEEIWNNELVPYRFLMREGIPAIMSGHLAFPNITGDEIPATISEFMLTELVRNRLNFKGMVVTDDLIMWGVQGLNYDTATLTKLAILAGNDLVLISRPPELHEKVFDRMLTEMQTNETFRARVIQSADRVIRIKLSYLKRDGAVPLYPDVEAIGQTVVLPEGYDFFLDQSFRSVSAVSWTENSAPVDPNGKILLTGQYDEFFEEGRKAFPGADEYSISYNPFYYPKESEKTYIRRNASDYDTIIFCLANPNSLEILKTLRTYEGNLIVLSVLTPVYLAEVPWVEQSLALYGTTHESFLAGFSILQGVYSPSGHVPLNGL